MNVTQSRIGQRVTKGYSKLFSPTAPFTRSIKEIDPLYLKSCFEGKDFLLSTRKNVTISRLNFEEGTSFTNEFIYKFLVSIFRDYKTIGDFERNRPCPEIFALNKEICTNFQIEKFFSNLDSIIEDSYEEITLNILELVEDSPYWIKFTLQDVDRIVKVAKEYLLVKHGLYEEDEDNIIHIIPQKCDTGTIVYNIVHDARSPLTIQEIIDKASAQYSHFSFPDDVVRLALREDTRIQYIRGGNQPTRYLLASDSTPTSIRDAIVKILSDSQDPVELDEIVAYVLTHFPSSSKNSIRTSILSDSQNRFAQFEGSRYGLSSRTYSQEFIPVSDTSRMSFAERLILLKKFFDEKCRFPSTESSDEQEVDFAKWIERNQDRKEVKALIDTYAFDIWASQCRHCEEYIVKHNGRLPSKEREPNMYKWLYNATLDMREDRLSQEQRKLFLHLKMQIRQ